MVKNPSANAGEAGLIPGWGRCANAGEAGLIPGWGRSLGGENGNSSIFAWRIPQTKKPGGL